MLDLKRKDYRIVIINLRDRKKSDRWNPLLTPYSEYKKGNYDRAYSLLRDIADVIFYTVADRKDDPYWDVSSRDLFIGLAFGLFEDAESVEEINLKSIYNMEISGGKKIMGGTTLLSEYYEGKEDKFGYSVSGLRGTVSAPNETKSSILSVFNQKLRNVTLSDKYLPILCDNTFDLESCINNKTAFILEYEDEKNSNSYIINILIKQIYDMISEISSLKFENGNMSFSMFLDDFLSMSYFPYLDKLLMGAKKRNVELCFSINSFSLLKQTYGEYLANALLENCDQLMLTDLSDIELLKYVNLLKEYGLISNTFSLRSVKRNEYILIDKISGMKHQDMEFYEECKFDKVDIEREEIDKEIRCFDFETYVMRQREERFHEKNISRMDIDDLISRIDKKIAELEQETKTAN